MKLKKKIMLVVSIAIMTLSVFLSDMQVYAANTYYVNYPEPMTDGQSGYCVVEVKDSSGNYYINTYFWYMYFMKGFEDVNNMPTDCGMEIIVTHDSITFHPSAEPTYTLGFYNLMMYTNGGTLRNRWNDTDGSIDSYTYNYKVNEGMTITGIFYKGNVIYCSGVDYSYSNPFIVFNSSESALALQQILNVLLQMDTRDGQVKSLLETYMPKLNEMLLRLTHIDLDLDDLIALTEDIISEFETANGTLDSIDFYTEKQYGALLDIKEELFYLADNLLGANVNDKNTTDGFKQDSDSQSSELDNLNQQTQVEQIDVDNVSSSVDANIDDEAVTNYGVVLSSITGSPKVIQLMLIVLSVGLISYVLYGKR